MSHPSSISPGFYTCSALTRHVILLTHLPCSLPMYLWKICNVSPRGTWGRWGASNKRACFSAADVPPQFWYQQRLNTVLLLRTLSGLAIFQQSFSLCVFFFPSICTVMTFCYSCFVGGRKKKDLLVARPKIQPLGLVLIGPPWAREPAYTFGEPIPPFSPIWKETPPIFNSSLFIFICHHVKAAAPLLHQQPRWLSTHAPHAHTEFQQVSST